MPRPRFPRALESIFLAQCQRGAAETRAQSETRNEFLFVPCEKSVQGGPFIPTAFFSVRLLRFAKNSGCCAKNFQAVAIWGCCDMRTKIFRKSAQKLVIMAKNWLKMAKKCLKWLKIA